MTTIHIALTDTGDWPKEFVDELEAYFLIHGGRVDATFNYHDALRSATAQVMKRKHLLVSHKDSPEGCRTIHDGGQCMVCDGGLGLCVICGGAEASLATECPGYRIGSELQEKIMASKIDFIHGWVVCEPVWFGNHVEACVVGSQTGTSRPYKEGFEITYTPGMKIEHGCEWSAVPEVKSDIYGPAKHVTFNLPEPSDGFGHYDEGGRE